MKQNSTFGECSPHMQSVTESFTCCSQAAGSRMPARHPTWPTSVLGSFTALSFSFCMHFCFRLKDPIATPTVRRPSDAAGRLRWRRFQVIGRMGNGVSDDAFEGSFRAGKSVVVAGLSAVVVCRNPSAARRRRPACLSLEGKSTIHSIKKQFLGRS